MKLVQQERFGECGVACAAMVVGVSLDELRRVVNVERGLTSDEIIAILARHGVLAEETCDPWDSSRPAILTVPSLNHPGLLHFIVWDGERFLDPTNEDKRYPQDGPVVNGERLTPQWATAIVITGKVSVAA